MCLGVANWSHPALKQRELLGSNPSIGLTSMFLIIADVGKHLVIARVGTCKIPRCSVGVGSTRTIHVTLVNFKSLRMSWIPTRKRAHDKCCHRQAESGHWFESNPQLLTILHHIFILSKK